MKVRIGTRKSELALWQAHLIARNLEAYGHETEIVKVVSFGDLEKDLPIHKLGDKGVFTKALDHALMMDSIDLAVHSLKDVPTVLDDDLILAAVPRRGNPYDVLVKPLEPLRWIVRVVRSSQIMHGDQSMIASGQVTLARLDEFFVLDNAMISSGLDT